MVFNGIGGAAQTGLDKELGGEENGPGGVTFDRDSDCGACSIAQFHRGEQLFHHARSVLAWTSVINKMFVNSTPGARAI